MSISDGSSSKIVKIIAFHASLSVRIIVIITQHALSSDLIPLEISVIILKSGILFQNQFIRARAEVQREGTVRNQSKIRNRSTR